MSDSIEITRATREEGSILLALIDALADFEKLQKPVGEARARLLEHGFGERPRFETWLARVEGKAVGYALAFETYSSFLALPTFYLEDLFVLPEYRKRKVGLALFTHLVGEAQRRGCGRMEWAVLDWNTGALRFYERLGARWLNDWKVYRLTRDDIAAIAGGFQRESSDARGRH
ncbi:MAG: GNAT family N-acetyltransferase [Acidobacteriia bacterium]|nr:GNAT family N-acetyltransferase [Terriglobia bacterium]